MTVEESKTATKSARKPLRVLHITFNMGIGGTEQVIKQLVLGMAEYNVTSEILCIDGHVGPVGEALQKEGVTLHLHNRKQGFDWSLIHVIRKLLKARQFDVIHCHQYTPWVYGCLGAMSIKAKVVFTEHGRFHPDRYRRKARLINPILARLTPSIVAISAATKKALVEYEYLPKSKIQVIYNGIKPLTKNSAAAAAVRENLGIPAQAFVVGTVSRLDPVKNQPMMLKAFKLFLRKLPDSYLLMVGDGPDKSLLANLADEYEISSRVIFTGYIDAPMHYLSSMDLFLLSSFTEGTSMTLLEAMSLGIPVVATDVGGTSEVIEKDITGKLVASNDYEAFFQAMYRLAVNESERAKMSENGASSFARRFSAKSMINRYLSNY